VASIPESGFHRCGSTTEDTDGPRLTAYGLRLRSVRDKHSLKNRGKTSEKYSLKCRDKYPEKYSGKYSVKYPDEDVPFLVEKEV
jgi:hypothetical protein